VLITYDENGGYPHPDHIRAHELSMYAWAAASDAARYPAQGEPWHIAKVYYDRIFNPHKVRAVHAAMVQSEHPRASEMEEFVAWLGDGPNLATTQINVADFFDARDEALRAHASQVEPNSRFFFWPNDIQRRAWPFEDYQLVESSVATSLPETDLFAGVPAETTEDTP
jgi:mycothiol S-conjugate amidase